MAKQGEGWLSSHGWVPRKGGWVAKVGELAAKLKGWVCWGMDG